MKIRTINQQINKIKKINSFSIALIITSQFIAYVLNLYYGISGGVASKIIIGSAMISILAALILKIKIVVKLRSLLLICFIILCFFYSFIISSGDFTEQYFIEFIGTGVLTFVVMLIPFDQKKVLVNVMRVGMLFILKPFQFVSQSLMNIGYDRMDMFASYLVVIILSASVLHLVYYHERKIENYILYSNGFFILISTITVLGRGPLLVLLLTIFVAFLLRDIYKASSLKSNNFKLKKFIKYIVIMVIGLLIMLYIHKILIIISSILNYLDIEVATITKSLILIDQNNGVMGILNNRNYRWEWAFDMIKDHPFFGNGIGEYANVYNTWPHNLFLQMFVEFGFFLMMPLVVSAVRNIYILFNKNINNENMILFLFLFLISVPRLFFSSYYWHLSEFWMFIFLGLGYFKMSTQVNSEKSIAKIIDKKKSILLRNKN